MATLSGTRQPLLTALKAFERDFVQITAAAATQAAGALSRYSTNGTIPRRNQDAVKEEIGRIIESLFVIPGTRRSFDSSNMGLSPFARALNLRLGEATWEVVQAHQKYLKATLPSDLWQRLATTGKPYQRIVAEQDGGAGKKLLDAMQIFSPDPLAQYEAAHTWVDPNGYRLSDRIWRTSQLTRQRIDALIADGLRQGWGADRIAKQLEQFLRPDRADLRTNRPYGRNASADAMRLARTEITRAHGQACIVAARMNPYVESIGWRLSGSHPKPDICDDMAAGGPYPKNNVPAYPAHPHCLCVLLPIVTATPAQVTADLRQALDLARQEHIDPYITTVQAREFLFNLLGREIGMMVLRQSLGMVGL